MKTKEKPKSSVEADLTAIKHVLWAYFGNTNGVAIAMKDITKILKPE